MAEAVNGVVPMIKPSISNVLVVAPAAIKTLAGVTVATDAFPVDKLTVTPPAGAGWVNITLALLRRPTPINGLSRSRDIVRAFTLI